MHAARAYGFGKSVIGIIIMGRKTLFPAADKAGRNGLSTDMIFLRGD